MLPFVFGISRVVLEFSFAWLINMAHLAVLSATRSAARFGFSEGWTRGTTTRSSCPHCPCSGLVAIALACSAASSPACPAVNYTVNWAASENQHKQSKYIRLRCVFPLSCYAEPKNDKDIQGTKNTILWRSLLQYRDWEITSCAWPACVHFFDPPPPNKQNKNLQ